MTCIAAVIVGDRVHMAADSMAVGGAGVTINVTKLVSADGIVVGVAGLARTVPMVRSNFPLRPDDGTDLDGWAQAWAEQITAAQLAAGVIEADDEHSTYGTILLGHAGRLWEVETNLAIPVRRPFHAIGSGEAVALGALHVACRTEPAPFHARLAVEAASEYQVDVGGPIETVTA